ncbi:anthrax toxin lethal factor-related metalloendopeptidase [Pseudobacteriovorax antillogorgiicola]|uniref:ATLF-like domain-containing protein n=1 Tax=Pseudobacteriovorax antillogorgiicola TaxID=1513793 RepID=A0A1Y6BHV2_9BACT|nr:hypothetical protein [Pseudobacteriovorax antillogorgiicola]TCS55429.1 hypothetical protein EDD56_105150 [Pseudobacteriovorax antillogorgiicola]SMF12527.1 hypothetical protein SAMN06296036_105174 [Pseudobacteriovorax antillogorgiicola]
MNWPILMVVLWIFVGGSNAHSAIDIGQKVDPGAIQTRCDVSYKKLHPRAYKDFEVVDFGASKQVRIVHLNEMMRLPLTARLFLKKRQIKVHLSNQSIIEFPKFRHLQGLVPRGWELSGYTWDHVPGAGDRDGAYLGHPGLPHSANSLALHEIGHVLDFNSGWSRSAIWQQAFRYWRRWPSPADLNASYRMSHIEEFVAAAIDEFYCSESSRRKLQSMYPGLAVLVADSVALLRSEIDPVGLSM